MSNTCLNHFGCVCSDESLVEESRTFESRLQSLLHDTIQESESSMEVQHTRARHVMMQTGRVVRFVGFFFMSGMCGDAAFFCPRCSASGRGCVEDRISPVTSLSWLPFFAYIWCFTASVWTGYQTTWSVLNNVNSCRHIWLIEESINSR